MTNTEMLNYLIDLVHCEQDHHNLDLESHDELVEFLEGLEAFEESVD